MSGPFEGREGLSLRLSELLVVCWLSGRSLAPRHIALIRLRVVLSLCVRVSGSQFPLGKSTSHPE